MTPSARRGPLKRLLAPIDPKLMAILLAIGTLSMLAMVSAGADFPGRIQSHARNLLLSFGLILVIAHVPARWVRAASVPMFVVGVTLLLGVALFGEISKGARRWLDLGIMRIQPSEIMKIGMPMMIAWWFHRREGHVRWTDFAIATVLLAVPTLLIARQPDLGTSILVFASGAFVIFFAGLSFKVIGGLLAAAIAALPLLWMVMHDYQRQRVLTLIDPTSDPLGKGFHTIQSVIAIGSGGLWGKGWMQGTQTHLEFIPEATTDFLFAVYSEEFGLVGNIVLVVLYALLIMRGLMICARAASQFQRLLAGALTMIFFTYAFVNMGMVAGILPVVGVPLPLMSYGGTAAVTLGIAAGLLMNIHHHRKLVQS